MLNKQFSVWAGVASLTVALSACGGSGERFSKPSSASGTITSEQAASFAESGSTQFKTFGTGMVDGTAVSTSTSSSSTMNFPAMLATARRGVLLKQRPLVDDSCTPTASAGANTDGDSDGIWASGTASFDCTLSSLFPIHITGSIAMTDKDDTSKFGGFTADISDFKFTITGDDGSELVTSIEATMSSTRNTSTFAGDVTMETTISASGQSGMAGVYLATTVTPTDMNDPVDSGGTVNSMTGFFKAEGGGQSYVLGVTGTNLVYDASCMDNNYKTGTLQLKDGSDNTIEVTYANCMATVTFNGTAVNSLK